VGALQKTEAEVTGVWEAAEAGRVDSVISITYVSINLNIGQIARNYNASVCLHTHTCFLPAGHSPHWHNDITGCGVSPLLLL
jgi:hypothetical protein